MKPRQRGKKQNMEQARQIQSSKLDGEFGLSISGVIINANGWTALVIRRGLYD